MVMVNSAKSFGIEFMDPSFTNHLQTNTLSGNICKLQILKGVLLFSLNVPDGHAMSLTFHLPVIWLMIRLESL